MRVVGRGGRFSIRRAWVEPAGEKGTVRGQDKLKATGTSCLNAQVSAIVTQFSLREVTPPLVTN